MESAHTQTVDGHCRWPRLSTAAVAAQEAAPGRLPGPPLGGGGSTPAAASPSWAAVQAVQLPAARFSTRFSPLGAPLGCDHHWQHGEHQVGPGMHLAAGSSMPCTAAQHARAAAVSTHNTTTLCCTHPEPCHVQCCARTHTHAQRERARAAAQPPGAGRGLCLEGGEQQRVPGGPRHAGAGARARCALHARPHLWPTAVHARDLPRHHTGVCVGGGVAWPGRVGGRRRQCATCAHDGLMLQSCEP